MNPNKIIKKECKNCGKEFDSYISEKRLFHSKKCGANYIKNHGDYKKIDYNISSQKITIDPLFLTFTKRVFSSDKNKQELNDWDFSKEYASITDDDANKVYKRLKEKLKRYCRMGLFVALINGDDPIKPSEIDKYKISKLKFGMNFDKIIFIKRKCSDGYHEGIWVRCDSLDDYKKIVERIYKG